MFIESLLPKLVLYTGTGKIGDVLNVEFSGERDQKDSVHRYIVCT